MKKILISSGYGAGWATWADDVPGLGKFLAEYQPIIDFLKAADSQEDQYDRRRILADQNSEIIQQLYVDLKEAFPEWSEEDRVYLGGARGLIVYELPDDTGYRITEYDGYESVELRDNIDWW